MAACLQSGLALAAQNVAPPAQANNAAFNGKLGFVDMQSAILQTDQGKSAKSNIEKQAESKRKDLQKQQDELKKMEEALHAESGVQSEEVKMQKQRDFGTKLQNFKMSQINFEQEIRNKEMQETQKIYKNLSEVIEEIAKKKSFDMVFEKGAGALLYASKIDDLTSEVVKRYNEKYKGGADKSKAKK